MKDVIYVVGLAVVILLAVTLLLSGALHLLAWLQRWSDYRAAERMFEGPSRAYNEWISEDLLAQVRPLPPQTPEDEDDR